MRLGIGGEVGQRLHRQRRIDRNRKGTAADQRDRGETLQWGGCVVVLQVITNGQRAGGAKQQRVAVGCCPGDKIVCNGTVGAGSVLDYDGLLERLLQLVSNQAGDEIRAATRGELHHDTDRLFRIGRRARTAPQRRDNQEQNGKAEFESHPKVLQGVEDVYCLPSQSFATNAANPRSSSVFSPRIRSPSTEVAAG